ncbi:MAG: hypothetical protein JXX29_19845 [Deltaproteobacteria bacterium]|nr:hypothetical protein [Deltaproteobacteria bacterium]MBN2673944.1 hypothetical protein [Deltaproteobacteria bacterium]
MQTTEFILAIIDKLLWPVTVVTALLVLRKPLDVLIPKATKVKIKDVELEFGKALDAVEENAAKAFPELKGNRRSVILSTAASMPSTAVLDAWKAVDAVAESLLVQEVPALNLQVSERYKLMEETLLERGLLDVKKGKLFSELRQLRNKVAHATRFQVGQTEAARYVDLCFVLVEHFEQLLQNKNLP